LCQNGFEIGLHGLRHDGKLYQSRTLFQERAKIINEYLREWDCVGFRSPSMHHNLEWIHDLNILYDSSTFDTDPFEPQPSGVGTIFPFHVRHDKANKGYIELPYTIPQDFTLFVLMKEPGIHIWKRKLDWIAEKGGMALINTHPDYMNFKRNKMTIEEYPVRHYSNFLE
jgi:peptidoglycan/xylan/chitin deacetylase (PgdA/CDA1 family)